MKNAPWFSFALFLIIFFAIGILILKSISSEDSFTSLTAAIVILIIYFIFTSFYLYPNLTTFRFFFVIFTQIAPQVFYSRLTKRIRDDPAYQRPTNNEQGTT